MPQRIIIRDMLAATVQHCTPMQSPCTDCRATAVWRLWSVSSHCTLCLTCPGSWQRHKECLNLVHHSSSCKQVCHSLLCITLAPMAACTILRKAKCRVWTETLKNWPCFGRGWAFIYAQGPFACTGLGLSSDFVLRGSLTVFLSVSCGSLYSSVLLIYTC